MCRSIRTLRRAGQPATDAEVEAAALQFTRKISGYREPSRRNVEAFDTAVVEIAAAMRRLLEAINPPTNVSESATDRVRSSPEGL